MRTAKFILMEDFQRIIDPIIQDEEFPYNFSERIVKDLSKVQFDLENCSFDEDFVKGAPIGYKILKAGRGTFPVLFLHAGGDWEDPLVFILYWDGKRVRGYVPKGGNTWDTTYRTAHGSQMESEAWPEGKEIPTDNPKTADATELENDIVNRIQFVL